MNATAAALAHALALQGKRAEAAEVLAPALEYFRAGGNVATPGVNRRVNYAAALYVSALAQGADAAGRRARQQALAEAAAMLASLPAEARPLRTVRDVTALVAAARAAPAS